MNRDTPQSTAQAFVKWYQRASRAMNGRDLLMLSPPGILSILLRGARDRLRGVTLPACDDLDARDPELVSVFADVARALAHRYFRLELRGVENIPKHGAALLVGNHNGGCLPLDTLFTALAVYDSQGPMRVVHGLAHDAVFVDPRIRDYALRLGAVRAGAGVAERALARQRLLLVYPGSDWDACRPFSQRGRVELHGRRGFLRLALRTGVPIVPVVSVGTHEQLVILTRGDTLARVTGMHRLLRTDTLPIALSLPWGVSLAYVPYLPLPAQTTLAFGPPLHFADIRPDQAEDEAILDRCYRVVQDTMQAMLDELSRDRVPILGRRGAAQAAQPIRGSVD